MTLAARIDLYPFPAWTISMRRAGNSPITAKFLRQARPPSSIALREQVLKKRCAYSCQTSKVTAPP